MIVKGDITLKETGATYHACNFRFNTPAHLNRWAEVEKAIREKGTYELTTPELTYGAKTSWRNAARCIGRIQWSKLQVSCLILGCPLS